ncbi:MAG: M23 family metallopeptidase, partial [Candidatus Liptonbacteria bacterium]|nr:M23 family metallopeptidase [Candidatus Liptonbacteria bacterium]
MFRRNKTIFFFAGTFLVIPLFVLADYGYFTMPVDPSTLSYSYPNTGINSWVDHTSPLGVNDTSSIFTRYTGVEYTGSSTDLFVCQDYFNGFGCYNHHEGIDYAVASGTSVLAAASGTVRQAQWQDPNATTTGNFGRFVRIWHGQYGLSTLYAHLSATTTGALAGNHANRQQLIGYSGKTGCDGGANPCGYHLHFQVYNADDAVTSTNSYFADSVDPYGWSAGAGQASDTWANDWP